MKTEQEKMFENVINKKSEESPGKTEPKKTNMLLAAFMMFIFPIMLVCLGIFLGGYIGKSIGTSIRTFQILGGVIAFIVAVIAIKLFDRSAVLDKNAEKIYWDDM
ncbi:SoxR reducing system RseC family protein [Clostridium sp. P21]|uniref:SoxR reducing system RseC family protein n=1 Tax=Clostridium muellerianum TaxID=2716538 RepID=A0A7Y0EJ21_9CLOT|nr:SoxR reducing system RseC family protein [Clostridium muellerianum]NMM64032.1 SoxR reducing system RseC family protein [Clostridium muellerianum]